ncbi:lysozyme family protein [Pararhizobium mangrovi]|uniref:Glycoside hydrolase family 104 protein n=1 Tax=Pararhizobium mangrovi TaxID=2590452 RepID=A0A506UEK3_9HYPH|nr:hypothetical protein [Pararhizobium mangrovi]TPW31179.1 hypothetical protein FJU11_02985 [Pararhizobium mangrovi]
MDPTVPSGAARLLDYVRDTETGSAGADSYRTIYGHNEDKLAKPLTSMTLGDVVDAQGGWSKRFGSSAAGGYQFMRATLQDLSSDLGLRGTQVFDPNLQDRLGYHLLKRRGYEAFASGEIGPTEFGRRLAMEWASFPVLEDCQGAHRKLKRGETYYAGDKLNKALIKPAEMEACLREVREMINGEAAPVPSEIPTQSPRPTQEADMPEKSTPAKQVAKAIGGGKGAAQGVTFAGGLVIICSYFGLIPPDTTPTQIALLSTAVTAVVAPLVSFVQAYMAPRNAE